MSRSTPAIMKVVLAGSSISARISGEDTSDLVLIPISLISSLNADISFQSVPYADWPSWLPILITLETTVDNSTKDRPKGDLQSNSFSI